MAQGYDHVVLQPILYTTGIMTKPYNDVIVGKGVKRTTGPERKGNAADQYEQLELHNLPV